MPTTNPYTTFARMRVDVQRLIAIARTEELREKLVRLIHVYDLLERKFNEQPASLPPTKAKPVKSHFPPTEDEAIAFDRGREAQANGDAYESNPHELTSTLHGYWAGGWRARSKGH